MKQRKRENKKEKSSQKENKKNIEYKKKENPQTIFPY